MYVVDFDHRSTEGPMLAGPFATKAAGDRWVGTERDKAMLAVGAWDAAYTVRPLHVPEAVS